MTKQAKPHDDGDDILAICKHQLDEAWINQPQLYNWYAMKCADARQSMDEAKATLEVVKAELSLKIRSNPGNYGFEKTTEKLIDAAILVQKEHSDALENVHGTRHDYDCLQGLLIALDHKKKALEKLVELQGRDYFSDPKSPPEDRERLDLVEKKVIRGGGRKRRVRVKGKGVVDGEE